MWTIVQNCMPIGPNITVIMEPPLMRLDCGCAVIGKFDVCLCPRHFNRPEQLELFKPILLG